jgi:hypothetical protein
VCGQYQRKVEGDLPWYYHERAQIGFLAAAVWRIGGTALEEWRTDKVLNGSARNGRGDLWIQIQGRRCWHIEAKHRHVRLGRTPKASLGRVRTLLRRACLDATAVPAGRGERRIGIVFIVPVIGQSDTAEAARRLAAWFKAVERVPAASVAGSFDRRQLQFVSKGDVHPGIVLLAARATKAN